MPMDFYFPGSKEKGDLPPRKEFAQKKNPWFKEKVLPYVKKIVLTNLGN